MKICVYGCGAIGGLLAARLARTGATVSVIARGDHLRAIQSNGLILREGDQESQELVLATDSPSGLGPQDILFLTLKSHTLPDIAPKLFSLISPSTVVVTAANGIPWWYFHGIADPAPELTSVDPGRSLWNNIGPEKAVGCVVYPAARVEEPGVIRHMFGEQFSIGEPTGKRTSRVMAVKTLLDNAGFDTDVSPGIRDEIWTKLVANAAFNPVSVMTGKTLGAMIDEEATYKLLADIMHEVVAVAKALDSQPLMTPDGLLEATRQLGDHKTSMLHDFEAGRSLELGPIVGAVVELAQQQGVSVDNLRAAFNAVQERVS